MSRTRQTIKTVDRNTLLKHARAGRLEAQILRDNSQHAEAERWLPVKLHPEHVLFGGVPGYMNMFASDFTSANGWAQNHTDRKDGIVLCDGRFYYAIRVKGENK